MRSEKHFFTEFYYPDEFYYPRLVRFRFCSRPIDKNQRAKIRHSLQTWHTFTDTFLITKIEILIINAHSRFRIITRSRESSHFQRNINDQ